MTTKRKTKAEVRAAHLQSLINGIDAHHSHNTREGAKSPREKYAGVLLLLAASLLRDQRDAEKLMPSSHDHC